MGAYHEVLEQAVAARRIGMILASRGGDDRGRVHFSFIPDPQHEQRQGIWVRVLEGGCLAGELARARAVVEVSFKTDAQGVFFDSPVLAEKRGWFSHRVLLGRPEQLNMVERRGESREPVPDGMELRARIGPPAERSDDSSAKLTGVIWDISTGGALLVCAPDALPRPQEGQPLVLTMVLFDGTELAVPVRVCNCQRLSISSQRVGVQFGELDASAAKAVERLVDDLRSVRIRRMLPLALRRRN